MWKAGKVMLARQQDRLAERETQPLEAHIADEEKSHGEQAPLSTPERKCISGPE